MDLSEQCGYTVQAQIQLFRSIKPLFSNKLVFLVINKIDVTRPEDLDTELQAELQTLLKSGEVELLQLSCNTQEGVQDVKNAACERLIADRVNQKLKAGTANNGAIGGRLADVMARIHVAQPMGGQQLETFVPEGIKAMKKYDKEDPERRKLARDVQDENGGAGVYNVDMRADYMLKKDEWKYDKIPEIFDGQNVYDFIDPDIEAKLQALEEEEEKLEQEGYYDSDEEVDDDNEAEILQKAEIIREKQQLIRNEARMKKKLKNQAIIPRKSLRKNFSELEDALDQLGVDTTNLADRAQPQPRSRGRSMTRSRLGTEDAMDVDAKPRDRLRSKSRAPTTNRLEDGVQDEATRTKAERIAKLNQKRMNRMARQGEADRHQTASIIKHLVRRPAAEAAAAAAPFPPQCLDWELTCPVCRPRASAAWARRSGAEEEERGGGRGGGGEGGCSGERGSRPRGAPGGGGGRAACHGISSGLSCSSSSMVTGCWSMGVRGGNGLFGGARAPSRGADAGAMPRRASDARPRGQGGN